MFHQCASMKTKCIIAIFCCIVVWSISRILHKMYRNGKILPRSSEQTGELSVNRDITSTRMPQEKISFDDIIIFIKTTTKNSDKRMRSLFESWLPDALKRVNSLFVLSDGHDPKVSERIPAGHFINSKCGKTHSRLRVSLKSHYFSKCTYDSLKQDMWCKTSRALTIFSETDKKWFCHFDDDMYLNIDNLLKLLREYDSKGLWYIGRRSEKRPHSIPKAKYRNVTIWFHNMGAGICLSRGMIDKMKYRIRNDGFAEMAPSIGLFDDLVLGFIINHELRINLTENYLFHSQRENMTLIRDLEKQITLGYNEKTNNYLDVDGFRKDEDPFRFRSLHCKIHPGEDMCRPLWARKAVLNVSLSYITLLLLVCLPFLAFNFLMFRLVVKFNLCNSLLRQGKVRQDKGNAIKV